MRRRGYTIIELLIVVAIIGLLITLGTYAWNSSGQRSRDSVRKSDLSRIQNALQQFYLDNRAYPEFDNSHHPTNLYSAGYQLSDGNNNCSRIEGKNFLTTKYLPNIPHDPKDSTSYDEAICEELKNQSSVYLYLAVKKDSGNPKSFALMATLENENDSDKLNEEENPVLYSQYSGAFEGYYVGGGSLTFFDPNYMITGSNGR